MDKPSCDNCGVPPCSIYKMYNRDTTVCEKWRRDPHKWLDISSIPPTEPGEYWWDREGTVEILRICTGLREAFITGSEEVLFPQNLQGKLQGPIKPRKD